MVNWTMKQTRPRRAFGKREAPASIHRQHPENQQENQAGHSSERTVEGHASTRQDWPGPFTAVVPAFPPLPHGPTEHTNKAARRRRNLPTGETNQIPPTPPTSHATMAGFLLFSCRAAGMRNLINSGGRWFFLGEIPK